MFTLQALSMGYRVVVLDPDPLSPAGAVASRHIRATYLDQQALADMASSCAAITTEFENVPAETLETPGRSALVRPPVAAVAVTQDRISEKSFLRSHGFATAPFHPVRDTSELRQALRSLPTPALLKTSRLGYDGKGQAAVAGEAEAARAFERFGGVPCILEELLQLECELSVIVARVAAGATPTFPVAEKMWRSSVSDRE